MIWSIKRGLAILCVGLALSSCDTSPAPEHYDVIVRGGEVYDGLGNAPLRADIAVTGDRIAKIADLTEATATIDIDASGMAVSPGFINMLSWATESLIEDGRGMSDIKQGVTLEVMGEGWSMGPLNDQLKAVATARQGDIKYDITWNTLGEYLEFLENKGISPNVASYVGATTLRILEVGLDDTRATDEQLARMQDHVRVAMREGAIGVGSSLIYAPAFFADTDEMIALVSAAAEYGGRYISHIRNEGNRLEEAVAELIEISRSTGAPAEIYHLKAAGQSNWNKLENVFGMIEAARAEGLAMPSRLTCTPTQPARPGWMRRCHSGFRKGVTRIGLNAWRTRRCGRGSLQRCELIRTTGRTSCIMRDRMVCCSSVSATLICATSSARRCRKLRICAA
jgi:N-acyl-D-amino-acid deacylase